MGIKPVGKAWGRSHVDKKSFIIWSLSLAELSSDLAGRSHSEASVVFQGLSLLRAGPGFPAMRAASQRWGPPCCQPDGAEGVSLSCTSGCIPDTSLPRDDGWLACCFCHLVSLMACLGTLWLCVWRACPQFFFFSPLRTSSTSLPLALSNPLFPKLLLSHLGGGTHSSFPTSPQLKAMRKPVTVARVSLLPPPPVYHDQGRRACRILSAAFGAAGGRLSISASSSA